LGIQVHGRFIPTDKILDVLINEAFLGFEVRYYLAVVVAGEDDIVVTFPTLLPGLDIVKTVWSGVRECLWEGDLVRRAGVDDETTSTTMTKH
jgi:phosphatidylinositol glycan class H protein